MDYFEFYERRVIHNSSDRETTSISPSTSIPQRNNHYLRDSSADSSDSDELSTTPTTPISPVSPTLNNMPNMQRRASESTSITEFKKSPMMRRYTLPSRIIPFGPTIGGENNPRSPFAMFWEVGAGRESSVRAAMDNFQFGS